MRILFLGLNYAPEQIGIGPYSADLLRYLADAGHKVSAVVAQPYYPAWKTFEGYDAPWWKRDMDGSVPIVRCPIYVPAKPTGLRRIVHHLSFALSAMLPMLAQVRRDRRPDLVLTVAPSLIAAPLALIAGRLAGAKTWLHVQDFELEAALATNLVSGRSTSLAAWFERTVLRSFDRVSTISPQMCVRLAGKGVAADRSVELRNWADVAAVRIIDRSSTFRAEWNICTPHVALYSGNIANKQGIDIVVRAARALHHRTDLTFVVCGEGPQKKALIHAAADLGNIQFHDLQPRDRLSEMLGLATVHLLPQMAGAADLVLPSKLTNMLASGRPVVATADHGTGLAQEVEGCGEATPPGDAAAFAAAIERLLDDAGSRERLGAAARRRAEERWSKTAILEQAERQMIDLARA